MAILDKLKFWKKEEEPGLGKDLGLGAGLGPEEGGLGLGKDTTSGLAGTGELRAERPETPMDLSKTPTDITMKGPGFEHEPEPSLRPAPLPAAPQHADIMAKDIEVISAKLDALRASLESINQRLASLERMMGERRSGW